jgi:transcription elongation GreA/GreB family factor
MYRYLNPRSWSLQAGTQLYSTPHLLAGALEQLERLADRRNSGKSRSKRAGPGCIIDLLDLNDNSRISFELVMPNEASPRKRRISVLSPLGASLLNLKKGDTSRVEVWGCSHNFEVLGIRDADAAGAAVTAK